MENSVTDREEAASRNSNSTATPSRKLNAPPRTNANDD